MEVTKDRINFLIETLRRNDMKAVDIHAIINLAWPDEAIGLRRVQMILKVFRDGDKENFEPIPKTGLPIGGRAS